MYGSFDDEKQPLLPVASRQSDAPTTTEDRDGEREETTPWLRTPEAALLLISFFLLVALILILYFPTLISSSCPLSVHIKTLAVGLQTSAWSSLPAPVILFALAPHIARPNKVAITRYTIFLLYLVGTVAGALLFGRDLRAIVLEVDKDYRA